MRSGLIAAFTGVAFICATPSGSQEMSPLSQGGTENFNNNLPDQDPLVGDMLITIPEVPTNVFDDLLAEREEQLVGGDEVLQDFTELLEQNSDWFELLRREERDLQVLSDMLDASDVAMSGLQGNWSSLNGDRRDEIFGDIMLGTLVHRFGLPDDLAPDRMTTVGTGIPGAGGPQTCVRCTGDPMVVVGTPIGSDEFSVGPICPIADCPTVQTIGCYVGVDPYCEFPERQPLPLGDDGRSLVTYRTEGYPEVVFVSLESLESEQSLEFQTCSGTLLSPTMVLTALHCITSVPSFLSVIYTPIEGDTDGWMRLNPIKADEVALMVYADATGSAGLVSTVHIPYVSIDDIYQEFDGENDQVVLLPRSDIALLELEAPGIQLPAHQFPKLDFNYGPLNERTAISFAGFGWSDYLGLSSNVWNGYTNAERFRALKFTAFNFLEVSVTIDGLRYPHMSWRNGDPRGTGGPCRADSGAPIFAGFNRGFWNDPRLVVGVVRGITGSSAVDSVDGCLDPENRGIGEELRNFREGICELGGGTFRGCGD